MYVLTSIMLTVSNGTTVLQIRRDNRGYLRDNFPAVVILH